MYASGEEPRVGDRITLRGFKPLHPAEVLEVTPHDTDLILIRWRPERRSQYADATGFVLVTPAPAPDERTA